jgi:selenide,water dikinase
MDPKNGRLTAYSHGAGCACKLGPSELAQVLRRLPALEHPDLWVGTDTGDDAAVWRRPDGRALVATVDFFTPLVDDPTTWGRIAAANAVSDVYAMGGHPLFALNVAAWPRDQLRVEMLSDVLIGGAAMAAEGGWMVVGGHTVDGPEPMYGQAVVGELVAPEPVTNAGAKAADALVLTKPLGTGIVATAVKQMKPGAVEPGGELHEAYEAAVGSMTRLNAAARDIMLEIEALACTDITGFGFLGHLQRMTAESGVSAVVDASNVPTFPGVGELVAQGFVPGGTQRNMQFLERHLDRGAATDADLTVLADAQTSGGLLFPCHPMTALEVVAALGESGHDAAIVGELITGEAGRLLIR